MDIKFLLPIQTKFLMWNWKKNMTVNHKISWKKWCQCTMHVSKVTTYLLSKLIMKKFAMIYLWSVLSFIFNFADPLIPHIRWLHRFEQMLIRRKQVWRIRRNQQMLPAQVWNRFLARRFPNYNRIFKTNIFYATFHYFIAYRIVTPSPLNHFHSFSCTFFQFNPFDNKNKT